MSAKRRESPKSQSCKAKGREHSSEVAFQTALCGITRSLLDVLHTSIWH